VGQGEEDGPRAGVRFQAKSPPSAFLSASPFLAGRGSARLGRTNIALGKPPHSASRFARYWIDPPIRIASMGWGKTKAAPDSTEVSADPHATDMQRLVDTVLAGPGTLDPSIRRAAAEADVPDALRGYLDKVVRHAYKVTDEDVEALREVGYSEDQIFEATVSCALGACLRRLEAGLSAIDRRA